MIPRLDFCNQGVAAEPRDRCNVPRAFATPSMSAGMASTVDQTCKMQDAKTLDTMWLIVSMRVCWMAEEGGRREGRGHGEGRRHGGTGWIRLTY